MSAINALSSSPNPLNPGSVSTSASTLLPLPTVQLTGQGLDPSPQAAGSSDPLVGPLPASIPEPSVLDMLGLLALGFGLRCTFRSAARHRSRTHQP